MDTHVQQIAAKYYGFRGSTKSGTMSAKLYEELSSKLAKVWGDYAGWAHSVSVRHAARWACSNSKQVLFTSDLKSFASYGLASPSGTSTPATPGLTPDRSTSSSEDGGEVATPLSTPDPQSGKRKRGGPKRSRFETPVSKVEETLAQLETAVEVTLPDGSGELSLADRVKRRRRGTVSAR